MMDVAEQSIHEFVIPHSKIRGCDWCKSCHVTFSNTH